MNLTAISGSVTDTGVTGTLNEQTQLQQLVEQHGSPLLLLDCARIQQQYRALKQALPSVTLHYALKPLPHPAVVSTLLQEGASFDLASSGEVDLVRSLGVAAETCIHTHPIKRDVDIRHALEYGCTTFVIDNGNELEKFIPYRDRVELLIRLSFRNPGAYADLSRKFGSSPQQAQALMVQAQALGIRIRGLSFHVGSQTTDPQLYVAAIERCTELIHAAAAAGLPALSTLDIGGGFPVPYNDEVLPIDQFCAPIRTALEQLPCSVRVLAEPGRFIAAAAITSVASVMGQAERDGKTWYYLDDGLYGSFGGLVFDHGHYPLDALNWEGERFPAVLAGPTCDSIDVISESIALPRLQNGDLIIGRMMGAYTAVTATDFNFFPKAKILVQNEPLQALAQGIA